MQQYSLGLSLVLLRVSSPLPSLYFFLLLLLLFSHCPLSPQGIFKESIHEFFSFILSPRLHCVLLFPQMLSRLLNSTHPEDLKAANKLIKEMVQEVGLFPARILEQNTTIRIQFSPFLLNICNATILCCCGEKGNPLDVCRGNV